MIMAEDKNFILDPLTTLCKVALINFMPDKTKLAINHHVLHIQEYGLYQFLERTMNRDSRIDLSYLNAPLQKAMKWYFLDGPERTGLTEETVENIKTITFFAIKGLEKLKAGVYKPDLSVNIILQYFINMLRDALNNEWREESYVKTDSTVSVLADKIKNNYEINTINSISQILNDSNKMNACANDVKTLIECAHKLLVNRDATFLKMMKDINTVL